MSLNDDAFATTEESKLVELSKSTEVGSSIGKYLSVSENEETFKGITQSSSTTLENTSSEYEESVIALDDDDEDNSSLQKVGDEKTFSHSELLTQPSEQTANGCLNQSNERQVDDCRKRNGKNVGEDSSVNHNSNGKAQLVDESSQKPISVSTNANGNIEKREKDNECKTDESHPINIGDGETLVEDMVPDEENISITNENGTMQVEELGCDSQIVGNDFDMQEELTLFQSSLIELGRRLWTSTDQKQQRYTKGCLWSPDGTCLLVPINLDGMHVLELPPDLYNARQVNSERSLSGLPTAVHIKEGGTVYDYAWYPFMHSSDPATCCWLASRQHEPIHMWDAFTGELRCTYRGYDNVDEIEAAISLLFSNDGQKVIGGYKKSIKIFDTNTPGREFNSVAVKQPVSCFAVTAENDCCVSTGSWNSHIYHYDLRAPKLGPLFVLGGHTGAITWLKYTTTNDSNWYLFSGARKDSNILQWDMRNYTQPLCAFKRNVSTNQRIYFDLDPLKSEWLISGDTTGLLKIWNLENPAKKAQLPLHSDCCNGVNFHPSLPVVATSSGQYHIVDEVEDEIKTKKEVEQTEKFVEYENSVILLWAGPVEPSK
uniref:WD repeat-containing protein 79 n=1 Tax=Glossina brevipalpis TaxID=37001 RepID=A0A1A9W2K6_9MUSC